MKQTTHSWIAIRAIDLVKRDAKTRGLGKILAPWVKHSYIGCWLPDMAHFKKGHGLTQNHTFKMAPYTGSYPKRFVVKRKELARKLDKNLALRDFVLNKCSLPASWWNKPYKAEQPDGLHLADCLSSIYDTIMDLILMGDKTVDRIVPGTIGYSRFLHPKVTIGKEQIAIFFFMMSHYIADSFMPFHCDARPLAGFSGGSHKEWEKHWDKIVGDYFKKSNLKATRDNSTKIIAKSKEVDAKLGLKFKLPITIETSDDVWEMAVQWCRASFALSSHIYPPNTYAYGGRAKPKFSVRMKNHAELKNWDRIVLQSAVYSVASVWKKIWRRFKD